MMISLKNKEKYIASGIVLMTIIMIILRFLLNEKGRVTPDSIRLMRTANALPEIDNTITPLGYPWLIKLFTLFNLDEFWASKLIGVLCYGFIIYFTYKKDFFKKEFIVTTALFSFVSLFSSTLTEALFLPSIVVFLWIGNQIINEKIGSLKAILFLSLSLIIMYNIRYTALFFMLAILLFGVIYFKKNWGKTFIYSAFMGFAFVILYKFLFIDIFSTNYVQQFLEIGLHPTKQLLIELLQGIATTFNPFIHIANPSGGIINWGIYGLGIFTLFSMIFCFMKFKINTNEKFLIFTGIIGITCTFFIQYFYSLDSLDYRLLSPFALPFWVVFFSKLNKIWGTKIYLIAGTSLCIGFVFSWLSKGNYMENRNAAKQFLKEEKLLNTKIYFYNNPKVSTSDDIQTAELISTINPKIYIVTSPKDTLKYKVLTANKVRQKMKINTNRFQ